MRTWRAGVPAAPNGRPDWDAADTYLLAHLAQHAAQGDELDSLVEDARFVATAEPVGLVPALRHVRRGSGSRVARAYRQLPHAATDPAHRAAYLSLSAQQLGDTNLRDAFLGCGLPLPWSVMGGAWRPPDEHEVVDRLEEGTTATTLLQARDGSVAVVTGDHDGLLHVRELVNGIAEVTAVQAAHAASVWAVAGAQLLDGRHLVCSGAADGSLRLWHLDMGLLVPFGLTVGTRRAAVVDAAVAVLPFGPVIATCNPSGTLVLAHVLGDGMLRVLATGQMPDIQHVVVYDDGGSPAVVGGTSDGRVAVHRPDGHGGFRVEPLAGTGRWSIGAVATEGGQSALIALGTGDRELLIYQSHAGNLVPVMRGRDIASSGISAVALVPEGLGTPRGGVLAGDHDGVVQFWAVDTDGNLALRRRSRPHQDEVQALSVVRTEAGTMGVSCGRDRKVAIWELLPTSIDPYAQTRDVDVVTASRGPGSVSVLLREGAGVERWIVGHGDTPTEWPLPDASHAQQGVPVTGTIEGSGIKRAFRADLNLTPSQPGARRRPVPTHPLRALAVGEIDGELTVLALQRDGKLHVHGGDDLLSPHLAVATGVDVPISLSLGYLAAGSPVVACGDADGRVRLRRWSDLDRWADAPVWSLGRADIRTAVSGSVRQSPADR